MTSRTRYREGYISGTFTKHSDGSVENASFRNEFEECVDTVLPGDNHYFQVTRFMKSGGLIYGSTPSSITGGVFNGYPSTVPYGASFDAHLTLPNPPSDAVLASQSLARTNPFKNEAVSLEYLSELSSLGKDAHSKFGDYLKELTRKIPISKFNGLSRLAKANLLYSFGISPLISDIELLLEFQQRVDRRAEVLRRLSTRGYKKTISLASDTTQVTTHNVTLHSSRTWWRGTVTKVTTREIKAHTRWYTLFNLPIAESSIRDKARKAILGYSLTPSTLYELMPWSWLIDYFTNLGDLVKANSNMAECTHDTSRIMTHTRTEVSTSNHVPVNFPSTSLTGYKGLRETKNRRLVLATLAARMPILTDQQASILGSLAVLKASRS